MTDSIKVKMPFATWERLTEATRRFETGGDPKGAPGQEKPVAGSTVAHSTQLDAAPRDLRVMKQKRTRVMVLTPFLSEDPAKAQKMVRYATRAIKDSIMKVEAPLNAATMYEGLNFRVPIERDIALTSMISWVKGCQLIAVYEDFGLTSAMRAVLNVAALQNKRIEYRTIGATA